ncbi:MAG: hypothetical protein R3Y22_03900 [Bacteroidales bacterium]
MKITEKTKKIILIAAIAAVSLAIVILSVYVITMTQQIKEAKAENEMLVLENNQLSLAGEYEQLNTEFKNYESQTRYLNNDSLVAKYGEAKDKVEKLLVELKTQKITSNKRIAELQEEISTLRGIMRHYVEQIDKLGKENAGLKAENKAIKSQNAKLNNRVDEYTKKNEHLTERITLAEKLSITSLTLTPLKKNGREERRIKNAKQLEIDFAIPQNLTAEVGLKDIFIRITNPQGGLLGNITGFEFDGGVIPYTERKTIEFTGDELPVKIYWNVNTMLSAGSYRVEVFADSFRLGSKDFLLE